KGAPAAVSEEYLLPFLVADRGDRAADIIVAGMDHGRVGKGGEAAKRLEEIRGASPHEVGPAGASREQGVAREEMLVHEECDGIRRVSGRVEDLDARAAERERRAVLYPLARSLQFRGDVREDGRARSLGEAPDARQGVGVRMGVQDMGEALIAGRQRLMEPIDEVEPWIDRGGRAAGVVHDEIAETAVALGPECLDRQGRGSGRPRRALPGGARIYK